MSSRLAVSPLLRLCFFTSFLIPETPREAILFEPDIGSDEERMPSNTPWTTTCDVTNRQGSFARS